jgi:hypothetical protein
MGSVTQSLGLSKWRRHKISHYRRVQRIIIIIILSGPRLYIASASRLTEDVASSGAGFPPGNRAKALLRHLVNPKLIERLFWRHLQEGVFADH